MKNEIKIEKGIQKWKVPFNIHLDINPCHYQNNSTAGVAKKWSTVSYRKENHFITENNIGHKSALACQGVLNICENFEEDGGFMLVPGFIHYFDEWYQANRAFLDLVQTSPSVTFSPTDHWLNKHAIRITMRPGSIVIWDSRTPHGAGPNNSSRVRCAQFIKMFEVNDVNRKFIENSGRRECIQQHLSEIGFQKHLTPLGAKLFGLRGVDDVPQKQDNVKRTEIVGPPPSSGNRGRNPPRGDTFHAGPQAPPQGGGWAPRGAVPPGRGAMAPGRGGVASGRGGPPPSSACKRGD